ncbi:MAG: structural protein P5 [Alistipes sp.]
MSRGLANRNPGNIRRSKVRYQGEVCPSRDPAFKEFSEMKWGYRAIFMLLYTYQKRHRLQTVTEMISRWAPPSENHTQQYIRYVADAVGVTPDQKINTLDRPTMLRFAAAISQIENGTAADPDEVEEGFNLFAAAH